MLSAINERLRMPDKSSILPRPTTGPIDRRTYAGLNVMVVEDAGHMSSLVCGILKSLGVGRIFEARVGSDALNILASQAVDMILIADLHPPYDGTTVVRAVRQSKSQRTAERRLGKEGVSTCRARCSP